MASTNAKAVRRADVLRRLSAGLNIQPADLHANAKGDAEMAQIMTLERLADAMESKQAKAEPGGLRAAILAATDDDLTAIPGIGDKSLDDIRTWAAEPPQTPPAGEQGDAQPSASQKSDSGAQKAKKP